MQATMQTTLKTVLIGAVESTETALKCLAERGTPPAALVTLPLGKAFRHSDFVDLRPLAQQHGVEVIEAANVNKPDILEQLREIAPDYILVIGWSQILKEELFAAAKEDLIGYHPAVIPENRGRAVIPWTILQRKRTAGATLFWLDQGMDTGDILVQDSFPIDEDETAYTLYYKQLELLERMLHDALCHIEAGDPPRIKQDHSQATYCAKRTKNDGLIDWSKSAEEVWTLIRAVTRPYPGAFTFDGDRRLTIWNAELVGEAPYWGKPGQVQAFTDEGALIQCGDGEHILVTEMQEGDDALKHPSDIFKMHTTLGIDVLKLYTQLQKLQEVKSE